jgi:hypothetical protein
MAVTARPLFTAQYASNAQTTYYTSTGVRTIIDKFTGYNGTGGAVTLAVNLVASGGAAGAGNLLVSKSLAAGETYNFPEIAGHVLESGGFISTIAGAATSVVIRSSGREVTS